MIHHKITHILVDSYHTNQSSVSFFSIAPQTSGIARNSRRQIFDVWSTFSSLSSNQASEIMNLVIGTNDDPSDPCSFSPCPRRRRGFITQHDRTDGCRYCSTRRFHMGGVAVWHQIFMGTADTPCSLCDSERPAPTPSVSFAHRGSATTRSL